MFAANYSAVHGGNRPTRTAYTWLARGLHRTMVKVIPTCSCRENKKQKQIRRCELYAAEGTRSAARFGRRCDEENERRDNSLLALLGWVHRNGT
ncbi:unnamed protein product [Ixodes pacificus]